MHYDFDPGLIKKPAQYYNDGLPSTFLRTGSSDPAECDKKPLSDQDIATVRKLYPPITHGGRGNSVRGAVVRTALSVGLSALLAVPHGAQAFFSFTPRKTRNYHIRTMGKCDTHLCVFNGETRVCSDEDVAEDRNIDLKAHLEAGKSYFISVRLIWKRGDDEVAVIVI